MLPMNFPGRRAVRKTEADARSLARSKRSPEMQLALLDSLNQTAARERLRLARQIDARERAVDEAKQTEAHRKQVAEAKRAAKEAQAR